MIILLSNIYEEAIVIIFQITQDLDDNRKQLCPSLSLPPPPPFVRWKCMHSLKYFWFAGRRVIIDEITWAKHYTYLSDVI